MDPKVLNRSRADKCRVAPPGAVRRMRSADLRSGRPRVVVVQEVLRRYRAPFYDILRTRLDEKGITLTLLVGTPRPDDPIVDHASLDWAHTTPVHRRWVRRIRREVVWQPCFRHGRGAQLVVVEQKAGQLVNYPLLLWQHVGGPRVGLWGHGGSYAGRRRSRLEVWLKAWMSRRPRWWFTYTDQGAEDVAALGFPADRITVVQNSMDTRALAASVESVDESHLRALRARLGLVGNHTALFLGSLRPDRRIGFLIAAADAIRAEVPDFELVVAGTGPRTAQVESACATRQWMHYVGPAFDLDAAALLRLSRLLLIPGWVGLVAVDSFAAGVPLVTSASAAHPPEFSYIRDGENGMVVDDGGDPLAYAVAVTGLLRDEPRRRRLVEGCLADREGFSLEMMAARFADGIARALAV
jgi:L-malate glycosyltransferase